MTDLQRLALAHALQGVFWLAFGAAALGLLATMLAPAGRIAQLAAQQPKAAGEHEPHPIRAIE